MALTRIAAALCACAMLAACGTPTTAPNAVPSPVPSASPAAARARYVVTFEATWHESTHAVPPNPHFSGLIGGTHREAVRFWEEGGIASEA